MSLIKTKVGLSKEGRLRSRVYQQKRRGDPEVDLMQEQQVKIIQAAAKIADLTDEERAAFMLIRGLDGQGELTPKQIGRVLNKSPQAVAIFERRAIDKIKKILNLK